MNRDLLDNAISFDEARTAILKDVETAFNDIEAEIKKDPHSFDSMSGEDWLEQFKDAFDDASSPNDDG